MIAILNDTHIGENGFSQVVSEHFLKFHLDQFLPEIRKRGIKKIIHLGDVFHNREKMDIDILREWKRRFFDVLEKEGIEMDVICGNHDTYYKNTNSVSSIEEFLSQYKNIKIYTKTQVIDAEDFSSLYVPWITVESKEETVAAIKAAQAQGIKYVFGHLEIEGFKMNSGMDCPHGIDRKLFAGFKRVMTGHFHSRSTQGNIFYLGSQYHMNWGDYGEVRGFHIFDPKKNTLELIENEESMFRMIRYTDEVKVPNDVAGKVVKVVVDERTDIKKYDLFITELNKLNPHKLAIIENLIDDSNAKENNVEAKDTLTIIFEYIDLTEGIEDKTYLKEMFSSLYTNALERIRLS